MTKPKEKTAESLSTSLPLQLVKIMQTKSRVKYA